MNTINLINTIVLPIALLACISIADLVENEFGILHPEVISDGFENANAFRAAIELPSL